MTPLRFLAVSTVVALLHGCASAPKEITYTGKLFSGSGLLPVTTVLWQDAQDQTVGRYVFVEPGDRKVAGTLGPCRRQPGNTLRCEWTDAYGRGYFYAVFSEDERHFNGRWGRGDLHRSRGIEGIWTGER